MTVLLDILADDPVRSAARDADSLAATTILGGSASLAEPEALAATAFSVEIVALRLWRGDDREGARYASREAFELLRAALQDSGTLVGGDPLDRLRLTTRAAAFGVLGDLHAQTRQLLDTSLEAGLGSYGDGMWGQRVEAAVHTTWQRLIRKRDWDEIDSIRTTLTDLRSAQADEEPAYLESLSQPGGAWGLVANYHLLRCVEILTDYTESGEVDGHFDPVEQAEVHFDRARDAASAAASPDLEFLIGLLEHAARELVAKSIWRAARGAGTRVSNFVDELASRSRPDPVLELLPPQRRALIEDGLLGSGRRSIVVSLPTSAGKTLLAEFRILQALDAFEAEAGWVAYTAPTRALVNQITARLRRDFAPLGIRVERFSPALEVDSVEAEILTQSSAAPFRVVVTTPEKLDLLIRGGWTSDLGRPLSLVIVDEAHNLGNGPRGLRLELLLATINREERAASFLLLTPFIPNASEVAAWLDGESNQAVDLGLEWLPNDRVIGIARLEKGQRLGDSRVLAQSVLTSAPSLHTDRQIEIASGRPLGRTYSKLNSLSYTAAAASGALQHRGTTVTLVQRPDTSWNIAEALAGADDIDSDDPALNVISRLLSAEYGPDYPLARLLSRGVAVHHAGLADDVRLIVEALAERGALRHIVATTTLAQGINFPISNVVLATHQYPYGVTMPPEDFWNIAGRAGRANHGQPGIVLLAAHDDEREEVLREYLQATATHLSSTLLAMVSQALERYETLDLARLSFFGEWSNFVQFIAHTYRLVGGNEFATRVEQVLRGTWGFRELRSVDPRAAALLVQSVQVYGSQLAGKPISLVDSTGFSWETVSNTLVRIAERHLGENLLDQSLLSDGSSTLSDAIGVLLQVPELREQLVERLDASESSGTYLSRLVKDWVAGRTMRELADDYFSTGADGMSRDATAALTRCCQRLFGSILPSISWGMSALQALTLAGTADDSVPDAARDIPSFIFYGVNTREAVALRLFGVPRGAASGLAQHFGDNSTDELRTRLGDSTREDWATALGDIGSAYFDAWRMVEPAV